MRPLPSPGNEQRTISAKLQHMRDPIKERQHPEQLSGLGMIEHDLSLTCHGR